MKFLKTKWRNLMMANYEVSETFLERYIPSGCELDLYKGRAMVSVVAFEFSDTSLCGIPMPFYRNFPEINLRIYVKRIVDGEWRRGVVFIKEIIPHKFPAWIARTVFRENFHVMPVSIEITDHHISYKWGEGNVLAAKLGDELKHWGKGTEEEFIDEMLSMNTELNYLAANRYRSEFGEANVFTLQNSGSNAACARSLDQIGCDQDWLRDQLQ